MGKATVRKRSLGTVYIGPVEIAGQYAAIAEALRSQGVASHLHLRFAHPFSYSTALVHTGLVLRAHRWIIRYRETNDLPHFPHRVALEAARRALWSVHAVGAIARYRTFVFAFATTFAPEGRDLPLLKLLGKRVVVVAANGSEARPPYVDGSHSDKPVREVADSTRRKRRTLRRIEKWAAVVIGAPLSSSQLLRRPFVNYFAMGMPVRPITAPAQTPPRDPAGTVRILHAPSRLRGKGTERIRAAVRALVDRGLPIEYVEVTNQPNSVVIAELAATDIVVDQLYSDTPMATLASEAAGMGRPSVVGGYGWDMLRRWVPDGMWPPSQTCHPDEVEAAITLLVEDPEYREELGRAARAFVRTRWSMEEVGGRWRAVLEGDIPNDWWVNPAEFVYTHGAAIREDDARRMVHALVEECGPSALQLAPGSAQQSAFLEFGRRGGAREEG